MPASAIRIVKTLTLPLLGLAAFEWYARQYATYSDALAPPSQAFAALGRIALNGELWGATAFTLGTAALGLLIGAVLGILVGVVLGLSRRAADAGFLTVEILRPIPSVALIPLAMLIFGFGMRMQVSVVTFACFWPLLVLSQAAARQVDPRLLEVGRALEMPAWQQLRKILIPAMVPRLFVALRLGVAIALVVAVTVEIATNPHGMGYAMMIAQQSLDPALMIGWLFWIAVVGYAINVLALAAERMVARRMGAAT